MAEIIDLEQKKERDRARRALKKRSKRMELMLQMLQCTRCAMKCSKCGSQLELESQSSERSSVPYRFCQNCLEEYQEFLQRLHGKGNPEYYWYNREWVEVWKAWMNYQDAIERYELSDDFRRLLDEFRER